MWFTSFFFRKVVIYIRTNLSLLNYSQHIQICYKAFIFIVILIQSLPLLYCHVSAPVSAETTHYTTHNPQTTNELCTNLVTWTITRHIFPFTITRHLIRYTCSQSANFLCIPRLSTNLCEVLLLPFISNTTKPFIAVSWLSGFDFSA